MTETTINSDYFKDKILSLRQKLHAMDGFEPVENISENVAEPSADSKSVIFSSKEKESHEN